MRRGVHWQIRPGRTKPGPDGSTLRVRSFGVRLGYWPCLKAPYLEISFNTRRLDVWFGLPSYLAQLEPAKWNATMEWRGSNVSEIRVRVSDAQIAAAYNRRELINDIAFDIRAKLREHYRV